MSYNKDYEFISNLFDASSLPEGASSDFWIQLLINDKARELQRQYRDFSFPRVGIVRKVKKLENLKSIGSKAIKDALIATIGDVQNISAALEVVVASVEIQDLTYSYYDLVKKDVTEEEFFDSLPKIYLNPATSNNRIPIKDEVVLLEYANRDNFTSVVFGGFPSEKPQIDPNLSSYTNLRSNSGKEAFPRSP